ncbi:hypothetical protein SAMN02910382_01379 [Butyrivibrio sp. TB]|nr:purine biosynthesis protein PurH [Butyrivibrio sp. TB]SEP90883.1 hypothetical protein SAMN02910382_01379 [Butyrivibrio sp. TB]
MESILIKDTTREQREQIVTESIGNISGSCDGFMSGLAEMYQDHIDGKKEIREINMEFRAHYESGVEGPEKLIADIKFEKKSLDIGYIIVFDLYM